jgi:hypothetical protein
MTPTITLELLERYEQVKGELERSPSSPLVDREAWELVDELVLDLHLINHGYATESYERHVERRLKDVCADADTIDRLRHLRL